MTTVTAPQALAPPTSAAEGMNRIAGLPVVPRASVAVSSPTVPAARLEIEFARRSLEQAFKRTYVPAAVPGVSSAGGLARFGPLALVLLGAIVSTSGGDRIARVLLGQLPAYVTDDDLRTASGAATSAGWDPQIRPAGLDTSDKLGRFIVGAAALGDLHQQGKLTEPMLAQALSRLRANIVAGRPATQGVLDFPERNASPKKPTPAPTGGTQTHPRPATKNVLSPRKPVPRVPALPVVKTTRTVSEVPPLPTVRSSGTQQPRGVASPGVAIRNSSPTGKPDLPAIPKDFDYSEAAFTKLLTTSGDRALQKRVEDYHSGRITREQAMDGLDVDERAKVSRWLNASDRSRLPPGGATGGRSATSAAGAASTESDYPAVKAPKNVYPDGQANLKNKIVKSLIAATGGALQRGQAVQLANLIGDKYKTEADALKITKIAGDLLKAGNSVERVAYALASSVKNADAFRHLAGGANIQNKTQADQFIERFATIKGLPKEQRARALADLIAGETSKQPVATKTENVADNAPTKPAPAKAVAPPALDTSSWGLPMGEAGETFFGKQRVPSKYVAQPNSSQVAPGTPAPRGKPKSLDELQNSLLGQEMEERGIAFVGNNFGTTARTSNEQFAIDLFKNEKNIANHFLKRTLADRPGQSPTSYSYGGHAAEGLFSKISGKTYTEIATNILRRVDELVKAGTLIKIGAGASNGVYLHKPTQQVIRVGIISSVELQATLGFSKMGETAVGAKLDLSKSLYLPNELQTGAKTEGFAVLFMERVPGMRLKGNGYLLSSSAKQKVTPAVADALVSMHLNNRSHGDFGTHNVMVTANGDVRIIDFDLAASAKSRRNLSFDLSGMTSVLLELYPSSKNYETEKVRAVVLDLYVKAVDRLAGPDRNAEVYRKQPELYSSHVARFNARKEALKQNAAAASKPAARAMPKSASGD